MHQRNRSRKEAKRQWTCKRNAYSRYKKCLVAPKTKPTTGQLRIDAPNYTVNNRKLYTNLDVIQYCYIFDLRLLSAGVQNNSEKARDEYGSVTTVS
jgi:hypothetical protein